MDQLLSWKSSHEKAILVRFYKIISFDIEVLFNFKFVPKLKMVTEKILMDNADAILVLF